jgi:hypothetical protein
VVVEGPLHVHESNAKRLPQGWPTLPDGCANEEQQDRYAPDQPHRGDFPLTDLHHRPPIWEIREHEKSTPDDAGTTGPMHLLLADRNRLPIVLSSIKRSVHILGPLNLVLEIANQADPSLAG